MPINGCCLPRWHEVRISIVLIDLCGDMQRRRKKMLHHSVEDLARDLLHLAGGSPSPGARCPEPDGVAAPDATPPRLRSATPVQGESMQAHGSSSMSTPVPSPRATTMRSSTMPASMSAAAEHILEAPELHTGPQSAAQGSSATCTARQGKSACFAPAVAVRPEATPCQVSGRFMRCSSRVASSDAGKARMRLRADPRPSTWAPGQRGDSALHGAPRFDSSTRDSVTCSQPKNQESDSARIASTRLTTFCAQKLPSIASRPVSAEGNLQG
jgi:hypothetical protein